MAKQVKNAENNIEGSLPKLQIYEKYILYANVFPMNPKSPSPVQNSY